MKMKCRVCSGRHFDTNDSLETISHYSDDTLVLEEVIQPLAREFRTERVWEVTCPECFYNKVDRVREEAAGFTVDDPLE